MYGGQQAEQNSPYGVMKYELRSSMASVLTRISYWATFGNHFKCSPLNRVFNNMVELSAEEGYFAINDRSCFLKIFSSGKNPERSF